jgi:hypothetical protein
VKGTEHKYMECEIIFDDKIHNIIINVVELDSDNNFKDSDNAVLLVVCGAVVFKTSDR